jgi:predicted dehydrogenase
MAERRLRVGVVGTGHFGRFHALKLSACPRASLVGLHDHNRRRAMQVGAETSAAVLELPALIEAVEAVVIAVPAATHAPIAEAALKAGRHVFVEKPIATTLEEADRLAMLADSRGLVLQVGHLERFSAGQAAIRARAGTPLYVEASRIGPYKPRGTDVSVVLDLMIHDLDLVLELMASPLERVDAVGAPVASALPDLVNARLRFASGAVATLTASRVAPRIERRMRIFGPEGAVTVDFAGRRLSVLARGRGEPASYVPGFGTEEASWEERDALEAEQAAFIAAVLDGAPVAVDGGAGRRALEAALRVEAAVAESTAQMAVSGLLDRCQHLLGGGF